MIPWSLSLSTQERNRSMNKKSQIKIEYEPEADVLSIASVSDVVIDHAREMGNVVVHFSTEDEPVLIEVLEASSTLKGQAKPFSQMAELVAK